MTVQFSVVGAVSRTIAFPAVHVEFAWPTVHKSEQLSPLFSPSARNLQATARRPAAIENKQYFSRTQVGTGNRVATTRSVPRTAPYRRQPRLRDPDVQILKALRPMV
jgi:hypothetical protein